MLLIGKLAIHTALITLYPKTKSYFQRYQPNDMSYFLDHIIDHKFTEQDFIPDGNVITINLKMKKRFSVNVKHQKQMV